MKNVIWLLFFLFVSCGSMEPPTDVPTGETKPMEITKVSASDEVVAPGNEATVSVFVRNINKDTLDYKWTSVSGKGTFVLGDTSSMVIWKAPMELGEYVLRAVVTSHRGVSDSEEITIRVVNFTSFSGIITNFLDEPLKSVPVKFRKWSTKTDSSGVFLFKSIPQEEDTLKIRKDFHVPVDTIITPDSTHYFKKALRIIKISAPENFIVEKLRENSVTLMWDTMSHVPVLKSFTILRGNSPASLSIMTENIDPKASHYEDINVSREDIYFYKIFCVNSENVAGDTAFTAYRDDMCYVPAGEFEMGSSSGDMDESPVHTVFLESYFIDKYEVSNGKFAEFLSSPGNDIYYNKRMKIIRDGTRYVPIAGYERHPVFNVTWHAAENYAQFFGKRLPTEAEWEKAARGYSNRLFPWGDEITPQRANYATQTHPFNRCNPPTTPSGFYDGNFHSGYQTERGFSPFGVYDLAGNVWEWVQDWYQSDFYSNSATNNPVADVPSQDSTRVLRGGGWINEIYFLRNANRFKASGNFTNNVIGFRCACDAEIE